MSVTLAEIKEYQDRLRREIMERECLLAALNVLRGHVEKGLAPGSLDLNALVSALTPSAAVAPASPESPVALPEATPPSARPPPPKPYINPDLQELQGRFGGDGLVVGWAIRRMTDDYSLRDIENVLRREGCRITPAKISVVLTRMKSRGEITEIKRGSGPRPATFRKPETAIALAGEESTSPAVNIVEESADKTESAPEPPADA